MDWINHLTLFPFDEKTMSCAVVMFVVTLSMGLVNLISATCSFLWSTPSVEGFRHNWGVGVTLVALSVGIPWVNFLLSLQVPPGPDGVVRMALFGVVIGMWCIAGVWRTISDDELHGAFGLQDSLAVYARERTVFFRKVDRWRDAYHKKYGKSN